MKNRRLVLGSASPYRKALLARLGVPFETSAPDIDEFALAGETPAATSERLAEAKARAVAIRYDDALVLGSDQVADAGGVALGKPRDRADAVAQLTALSGRSIVFHTGVALVDTASARCHVRRVDVTTRFRRLSAATIDAYLDVEQPFDCAGSVKSEGLGIALLEAIDNRDPSALIGLPLIAVVELLLAEGVDVVQWALRASRSPGLD